MLDERAASKRAQAEADAAAEALAKAAAVIAAAAAQTQADGTGRSSPGSRSGGLGRGGRRVSSGVQSFGTGPLGGQTPTSAHHRLVPTRHVVACQGWSVGEGFADMPRVVDNIVGKGCREGFTGTVLTTVTAWLPCSVRIQGGVAAKGGRFVLGGGTDGGMVQATTENRRILSLW